MQSRLLFLTLVLRLSFTVTPIPRPDVALSVFDDGLLTTPPSNEQLFDIISPIENIESEVDLFSLNNCLDTANLLDPFWDGGALQAREDICPSRPPEAESSTDEENTGDPGDNANSHSSERINPDIPDTGFQFDNEPLRRMFSLPQDYQDERCNEYGFIRYAICSSGDFRDETKSMAYSFYPVQAYTLRRCTFSEFGSIYFSWRERGRLLPLKGHCDVPLSISPSLPTR